MARDEYFEASLHKVRRKVYYIFNEKIKEFEGKIAFRICRCFAIRARKRLTKAQPKDLVSKQKVEALAKSINVRRLDNGTYSVRIPADEEGLFMFLEFGTGILGDNNKHPESNIVGWEYNVKADSPARMCVPNGGWVFKRLKDQENPAYVDKNDVFPLTRENRKYTSDRVVVRSSKNGRNKMYTRSRPYTKVTYKKRFIQRGDGLHPEQERVMSWGIKPIRYIYDTKQEIRELFYALKSYKKGHLTMQDVLDKIEELENKEIN